MRRWRITAPSCEVPSCPRSAKPGSRLSCEGRWTTFNAPHVSGDILLTEPVEVSVDIEARLDDANPQTSPMEPSLLVDRVAESVAKTVKALPEEQ